MSAVISTSIEWTSCLDALPEVNERVLLARTDGHTFIGERATPDPIWKVSEPNGREHWVYDPENYTDDVDSLVKSEDCMFSPDSPYEDYVMCITSTNYIPGEYAVIAWAPLPKYEIHKGE